MTAVLTSPAQIVNYALSKVGYEGRIGNLYDGSPASRNALDLYGQTRDRMIRDGQWDFAERVVTGTLQKQAPPSGYAAIPWSNIYTAPPWRYQYAYPSDCLKLRSAREQTALLPNFDPRYNATSVENDNSFNPPQKVILCDVPNAILTYAAQVTDPSTWEAEFVEEFADGLGKVLAPVLKSLEAMKYLALQEQADRQEAMDDQG